MTGAGFAAIVLRTACLGFLFISTLDAAFATGEDDKAKAATCLSGPKGAAPAGERWRFRVERGSKRHCWYTRADAPRKTVAQRAPSAKPVKDNKANDLLDAEPLQLSVANARAEADLSASPPPIEPSPVIETRNPAWTMAERWSQNSEAAPVVQAQLAPTKKLPEPALSEPPDVIAEAEQDSFLEMAAGAVALLGLSVVLVATLMRRRKRDQQRRDWPPAQWDENETFEPVTDLNDQPLMTWRKTPKERLETLRRAAELRDATSARITKPSPVGPADFRRTPTSPPGARA